MEFLVSGLTLVFYNVIKCGKQNVLSARDAVRTRGRSGWAPLGYLFYFQKFKNKRAFYLLLGLQREKLKGIKA